MVKKWHKTYSPKRRARLQGTPSVSDLADGSARGQVDVAVFALRGKSRFNRPVGVFLRNRAGGLYVFQNALLLRGQLHARVLRLAIEGFSLRKRGEERVGTRRRTPHGRGD